MKPPTIWNGRVGDRSVVETISPIPLFLVIVDAKMDGESSFMLPSCVFRSCQALLVLPIRRLVRLVQQFSQWAVSKGRGVRTEQRPIWENLRPQSRILKDPPAQRAVLLPLQARWLARVLVASRPLGP